MKKYIYSAILSLLMLMSFSEIHAQGTENFEDETAGTTTFTENSQGFTITNGPGETTYDIEFFTAGGWNGSAPDNQFIDNSAGSPTQNDGSSFTITTTDGADISVTSLYIFVSTRALLNPTSSLTITGKKNGATEYTITKSSGFSNVETFSPNNGFTFIDFATEGAADYSTTKVDELIFSTTFNGDYIALDNFIYDFEVVEADPPEVQSISVVGSPTSTDTSLDFLVTFNEDAFNVDTSDFALDAVGTSGTLSAISGSGTTYTVTVSSISGEGTISIDLGTNDIEDALGNNPSPAFASGETHTVSRCFQETFESFIVGDFMFSSNGVVFTTGTANFNVENFVNGGAGSSDQFLSNDADTGTGKIYSITTPGTELFNVEAIDVFLSSIAAATSPTNDGSIVLQGKLTGSTLYTITVNTGFPSDFSINNGFTAIDFATAGASDYSLTNIDELEIELGGAFVYIALDNFEHCEEVTTAAPPIVQSIKLVGNPLADAATVDFEVIFNEDAVNVSTDDFVLNQVGTAVGAVASISGSGNTYIVTVNTISGEGSIRLDLNPGTNIEDTDGNTPPDPFTMGEVHLVSDCNVETFEALAVGANAWTTDIHPFTTNTTDFKVDEFINAGAGGSDRFLCNITDQGTGKVYSIAITDANFMFMNSMEVFLSSITDGTNPTDDGTLTVVGKLDGVDQFITVKSTGFPTIFGTTQGFYTWDFAIEGGTDNSMVIVDELEITLGGSFQYVAIDNFKFCDVCDPPVADVLTNVTACESYELLPLSAGNQYFTETGGAGTELFAGGTVTSSQTVFIYAAATAPCVDDETSFVVTVNSLPTAAFTAPADLCLNVGVQTGLGGGTPSGGMYSGAGVTDNGDGMTYSFDPAAAGVGTHTLTYTAGEPGCTDAATDDVEVFALPIVTFTAPASPNCTNTILTGLEAGTPVGGVYSGPGVTDDGNGMTYSFDSGASGNGAHILTYTFTDGNGCTNSASDNVTVIDNTPPTLVDCPADIELFTNNDGGGDCEVVVNYTAPTFADNCDGTGTATYVSGPQDGDSLNASGSPYTVIYTYEDTAENVVASHCSFTITVTDNTLPTLSCPGNITVINDPADCGAMVTYTPPAGADNCPGATTALIAGLGSGAFFPVGETTETYTVTDAAGNQTQCTFVVKVNDTEPPVLTCVETYTLELNANGEGSFNVFTAGILISQADNCGVVGGVGVTGPSIYTCDNLGEHQVTIFQDDAAGNQTSCSFTLIVTDPLSACNQPPVAVCKNITLVANANCQASIVPSDIDGGSSDPDMDPLTLSVSNIGPFNLGTYPVTLTVSDGEFTDSCAATVTVVDGTAPLAVCKDISIQLDARGVGSITTADIDAGSVDNCGIASISVSPSSFDCSNVGQNLVTMTVTDTSGNISSCTSNVNVIDAIAPIVPTQDITVELDVNGNASIVAEDVIRDYSWVGYINLFDDFGGLIQGSVEPLENIKSTLNDGLNTITLQPNFTFFSDFPNSVVQGNTYIEETSLVDESFVFTGTVVSSTLDLAYEKFAWVRIFDGGFGFLGEIRDPLVNGSTFSVVYNNDIPSSSGAVYVQFGFTILGPAADPANEAALGNVVVEVDNKLTDACGELPPSVSQSTFNCNNLGDNVVSVSVTDNNGNITTETAIVKVIDTKVPTISCVADVVQASDAGYCTAVVNNIAPTTAEDNCSVVSVTYDITGVTTGSGDDDASGTVFNLGTSTVIYTIVDSSDNVSTCSFDVVINNIATTTSVTVAPISQQYSDLVDFEATIVAGNCPGAGGQAAAMVEFFVGTQSVGSALMQVDGENLVGHLTAPLLENPSNGEMSPGLKVVKAMFGGVNPNYIVNDATTSLTITKEDAIAEYTGLMLQATAPKGTTATVDLSFNIQDITCTDVSDPNPGDIRNAIVDVYVDGNLEETFTTIVLVNASDTKTGTVTFPYTFNIGNSNSESYTIRAEVRGYYTGSTETLITVYKPVGDFITGGGYILPDNSAGQYASTDGLKTNFGFNVGYNKKGNKLKGHMNIIFRRMESDGLHKYQIKGNAIQSLGVDISDMSAKFAQFITKANLTDITDPQNTIGLGGNLILKVDITDRGEPGTDDTIAINLTDGGTLLYSSNWTGISTAEIVLSGGNLLVHSGFSAPKEYVVNNVEEEPLTISNLEILSWPNPSESHFNIKLQSKNSIDIVKITVFDVTNKLVHKGEFNPNDEYRFGARLEGGTYIINVMQGNTLKQVRLVKY